MDRSARTKVGLIAVGLCLPIAVVGCGSNNTATTTSSTAAGDASTTTTADAGSPVNSGATVSISEFKYDAPEVTIKANQAVSWKNEGKAKHTVTATEGQAVTFKSPTLLPPPDTQPFVFTFGQPGTYTYFCSIHGKDKMSGTIIVTP